MYCTFITPLDAQSRAASRSSLLLTFAWGKRDEYRPFPWNELTLNEVSCHVSW
jgi:hypothetical protein